MLDKDLIENAKVYDYGVSRMLEDTLKWLLININRWLELHKSDLKKKRKGAALSSAEPRLIWTAMIPHPNSTNKSVYSLTRKFNNILEDVMSGDTKSHIMKIHLDHYNNNFDRQGDLTANVFIKFWREVDATMSEFDRGKTQLSPHKKSSMPAVTSTNVHEQRMYPKDHNSKYKWFKKN